MSKKFCHIPCKMAASFDGGSAVVVFAGAGVSACIDDTQRLWVWGSTLHGVVPRREDKSGELAQPRPVQYPLNMPVVDMSFSKVPLSESIRRCVMSLPKNVDKSSGSPQRLPSVGTPSSTGRGVLPPRSPTALKKIAQDMSPSKIQASIDSTWNAPGGNSLWTNLIVSSAEGTIRAYAVTTKYSLLAWGRAANPSAVGSSDTPSRSLVRGGRRHSLTTSQPASSHAATIEQIRLPPNVRAEQVSAGTAHVAVVGVPTVPCTGEDHYMDLPPTMSCIPSFSSFDPNIIGDAKSGTPTGTGTNEPVASNLIHFQPSPNYKRNTPSFLISE
eukprot:Lankesteria_metandrocarpae@DN10582_c0_g1_i1.p1